MIFLVVTNGVRKCQKITKSLVVSAAAKKSIKILEDSTFALIKIAVGGVTVANLSHNPLP